MNRREFTSNQFVPTFTPPLDTIPHHFASLTGEFLCPWDVRTLHWLQESIYQDTLEMFPTNRDQVCREENFGEEREREDVPF